MQNIPFLMIKKKTKTLFIIQRNNYPFLSEINMTLRIYSYLCTVQENTKMKKYKGVEDDSFKCYWLCQKGRNGVLI